jgi:hypothetical protein
MRTYNGKREASIGEMRKRQEQIFHKKNILIIYCPEKSNSVITRKIPISVTILWLHSD